MDVDEEVATKATKKGRSRRYIPHLAEFRFQPTFDWSTDEAQSLYHTASESSTLESLDSVIYDDCISGMQHLPSESVNLVIADPPFGIEFDGKSSVYNRDGTLVVDDYEEVTESYESFTEAWIDEIPRILTSEGSVYIFSGWTNLESVLRGARKAGLHTINHIVWHYPFGVFTKRRFVSSHYHILLLVKNTDTYFFNKLEHYPADVWTVNRQYRAREIKNGTKLPLDVVSRCIDYSSRPGDIILDPFMGNGTTAAAAKANYRHFIGFEINKRLRRIIDSELKRTELGSAYIPYTDRLPDMEELKTKYPRAYREYLRSGQEDE